MVVELTLGLKAVIGGGISSSLAEYVAVVRWVSSLQFIDQTWNFVLVTCQNVYSSFIQVACFVCWWVTDCLPACLPTAYYDIIVRDPTFILLLLLLLRLHILIIRSALYLPPVLGLVVLFLINFHHGTLVRNWWAIKQKLCVLFQFCARWRLGWGVVGMRQQVGWLVVCSCCLILWPSDATRLLRGLHTR